MVLRRGERYHLYCGIDKATADAFLRSARPGPFFNGRIRGQGGSASIACRTR